MGCSEELKVGFANSFESISGKVQGVNNSASLQSQSSCLSEKVSLFRLEDGDSRTPVGAGTIDERGEFQISVSAAVAEAIKLSRETSTRYLLEFSCNDIFYQRFLTNAQNQNIGHTSTVMAWVLETEAQSKLKSLPAAQWDEFFSKIGEMSSLTQAFSTLASDSTLKARFESDFGIQLQALKDAPPKLVRTVSKSQLQEGVGATFAVSVVHWSATYQPAFMWRLGSDVLSSSQQMLYKPSADKQGYHIMQLFVGSDNGSGAIDFAKPYAQRTFNIEISNDQPAVPPVLTRQSSAVTNQQGVSLRLATGPMVDGRPSFCQSFSGLTIVESSPNESYTAPSDQGSYASLDCAQASTQDFTFSLSGAEGIRRLHLWARDSAGQISETPREVTVHYDATAPQVQWVSDFSSLNLRGGQSFDIQWNTTESLKDSVNIDYSIDGGSNWLSVVSGSPDDGAHTWTVPAVNSSQVQLRLVVSDQAGNSTTMQSPSWTIDSQKPAAPSLTLQTPAISNQLLVSVLSQNCTDTSEIFLSESATEPSLVDLRWQDCSTVVDRSLTLTAGDGNRTIYSFARDFAGNISVAGSFSVEVDQVAPVMSLFSLSGGQTLSGNSSQIPALNQKTVSYSASDAGSGLLATPITLRYSVDSGASWTDIASGESNTSSYVWTLPEIDSNQVRFQVHACDKAGNCADASSSSDFTMDSTAPNATALQVNSGALMTDSFYVSATMESQDNLSGVSHICLMKSTTVPQAGDSCWTSVVSLGQSVATSVTATVPNYLLGFSAGFFNIKAFVKDQAGNVSILSSSGNGTLNTDLYTIQYEPGTAPVVAAIVATNDDSSTAQPSVAQTSFSGGQSVYIKWHISDDYALPAGSINLYYTTDEQTFTVIDSGLENQATGGCTASGSPFTGCYVWTSPGAPAGYFKVRIEVTDSASLKTLSSTSGLNTQNFNVIAGNTDPGLGGSATSAVLYSFVSNEASDPNSLVVDNNGVFYFKDYKRGILKIDPSTGLLTSYIPKTGSFTGDGGPAGQATLRNPTRIAIDKLDRLYIYDHNRILRVETDGTLNTVIGGGGSASSGTLGSAYSLGTSHSTFMIAPNNDLYFTDGSAGATPDSGFRLKHFKVSDGRVYHIELTGVGRLGDAADTINDKRFDGIGLDFDGAGNVTEYFARVNKPVTGGRRAYAVSFDINTGLSFGAGPHRPLGCVDNYGRDTKFRSPAGNIYTFSERCKRVYKLDKAANTWTVVFGSGVYGRCVDDTVATSCDNTIEDVFVDSNEQIYLLDNGMVRTIVDGKVKTLFGQPLSSESISNPLAIRFPALQQIEPSAGDKIVINDHIHGFLWEVPRSGNIVKLAGNGTLGVPAVGNVAATNRFQSHNWAQARFLAVHPVTNDIYIQGTSGFGCAQPIKLNRSTGVWDNVLTGCGSSYWDADGTSTPRVHYIGWSMLGFDSDLRLLASTSHWSGIHEKGMVKAFENTTFIQRHFIGADAPSNNGALPADGTDMETTNVFPQHAWGAQGGSQWDATNSQWLVLRRGQNRIAAIPSVAGQAGNISTLTNTEKSIRAFTYRVESGDPIIYYCATDGRIYRRDVNAATESPLTWPSPTISCDGKTMSINANLDRLEFIFSQNGLFGVAEIQLAAP